VTFLRHIITGDETLTHYYVLSRKKTPEYGMETSGIAGQKKVQNATNSEKMMFIAFGIIKSQYWNIIKRRAQR
jgi:hypothetical protein